jgi:hypothetical protein
MTDCSASARISKGQGWLLKEKGREQFWPKKGQFALYNEKMRRTPLRVNNTSIRHTKLQSIIGHFHSI